LGGGEAIPMGKVARVHLIMSEDDQPIVEEISRQCQVTCWNRSLDEAVKWAGSGAGAEPDILLVNSSQYITGESKLRLRKYFISQVKAIKQKRCQTRIVLLIPLSFLGDLDLVTSLMKLQIYDLWFLDSFDKWDINQFITQARTPESLELYIKELETLLINTGKITLSQGSLPSEKIFKPYYIKSNVLAFYSSEDILTNTGLAVLTALNLAQLGFKVGLVETISPLPQLAAAMTVRHPYFNTSHALAMYSLGNREFLKKSLFNSTEYLEDTNALDNFPHLQYYPETLFFLPDGRRQDNLTAAEVQSTWPDFAAELTKIAMFEQNYHFLIYLCNGHSPLNDLILKELANLRFMTISLLPGSIVSAREQEIRKTEKTRLIVSGYLKYVVEELEEAGGLEPLYCSAEVQRDFLNYLYFKNYSEIGAVTQDFINNLLSQAGVRLHKSAKNKGLRAGIAGLSETVRGVVKSVKSF